MDNRPITVDLDEHRQAPIGVWICTGDQMTRLPGRMDNVIVFSHQQGAPPGAWAMAAIPNASNEALLLSLIESLQKYAETSGFALSGKSQVKPRPPDEQKPGDGNMPKQSEPRRVVVPLPPGTTTEQAEELANQLRAKVGLRPAQPRPE